MQQWEYKQYPASFLNDGDWQEVGREGWELVSVSDDTAYFRRPVYPSGEIVLKGEQPRVTLVK